MRTLKNVVANVEKSTDKHILSALASELETERRAAEGINDFYKKYAGKNVENEKDFHIAQKGYLLAHSSKVEMCLLKSVSWLISAIMALIYLFVSKDMLTQHIIANEGFVIFLFLFFGFRLMEKLPALLDSKLLNKHVSIVESMKYGDFIMFLSFEKQPKEEEPLSLKK